MENIYIVAASRIPFGRYQGFFKNKSAIDLGVMALKGLLQSNSVPIEQIDGIFVGNVLHAGLGQNIARQIALKSGLSEKIIATTIDDVCGSSLKALRLAQGQMLLKDLGFVVVGGTESMTNAPLALAKNEKNKIHPNWYDTLAVDGLNDAYSQKPMGITAENVADRYNVTRKEMDFFAYNSQVKAYKAVKNNWFKNEIIPITLDGQTLSSDENIRPNTNMEKLANLKPVFKVNGRVTAGNSSPLTDGASMILIATAEKVAELNLKPIAQLGKFVEIGCDPAYMGYGPYYAIKKLLQQTQKSLDDYDLIEINEAFAAQAYAVARDLHIPEEKLNIAGGAISLGHPLGATGTRLVTSAINSLNKVNGKCALLSLCIGGGQAIACEIRRTV